MIRFLFKLYALGLFNDSDPKILADVLSIVKDKAKFKKNKGTLVRILNHYKEKKSITPIHQQFIKRVVADG